MAGIQTGSGGCGGRVGGQAHGCWGRSWEERANHWLPRFCPVPPGERWHFLRQREWLGLWPLAEILTVTKELWGILSKSEITQLLTHVFGECSSSLLQTAKLPPSLLKSQGTHLPITRVSTGTWVAPRGLPSPQLLLTGHLKHGPSSTAYQYTAGV